MKKIKSLITRILSSILFIVLCISFLSSHFEGSNQQKINDYEKMIADHTTVLATLSSRYLEKTIKIMRIPSKTYEFDYTFLLDDRSYSGKVTLSALPESRHLALYYLKENPEVISINPVADLKAEKEKETSNASLYWGIIFGILGLLLLLSLISDFSKMNFRALKNNSQINSPQKNLFLKTKQADRLVAETVKPEDVESETIEPTIDKEDPARFMPFQPEKVLTDKADIPELNPGAKIENEEDTRFMPPHTKQTSVQTGIVESVKEEPVLEKEDPRRFMPK